jgi:very-short-patch-repair endonuclease
MGVARSAVAARKTQAEERLWAIRDRSVVPVNRIRARAMRLAPTEAERKLWWHLRHRLGPFNSHFRRQALLGPYIADFVSHGPKLIIEVDGAQHGKRRARDAARTRFLESQGYRLLRFWNSEVLRNIDAVLEVIQKSILGTPTPNPSPQEGGEQEIG